MKFKPLPLLITAVYLCALTYTLVWVPWTEVIPQGERPAFSIRAGYGLIWKGPDNPPSIGITGRMGWANQLSRPDVPLIALRCVAVTCAFVGLLALIAVLGYLFRRFPLVTALGRWDKARQS